MTKHLLPFILCILTGWGLSAQLSVTLQSINPSCDGFTDGSVTATPSGGSGNYTYAWNTGSTGNSIAGLSSGTYTVTVVDDGDSTSVSASTTLTANAPLTATATQTDVCNTTDVDVSVSGGDGNYTYAWSNGATGTSQSGLAPGQYCVTVTDGGGCADVGCVTVVAPLSADLVTTILNCANFCDASVTALVSGGVAPYTYAWNTGSTGPVLPNVPIGTYTVTITDGNGCQIVESATVTAPPPLTVDITSSNPDCGTGQTGSATATGMGGVPPYSYAWSNGATTQTISNLAPGVYTVSVTDQNSCVTTESVTIIAAGDLTLSVSTTGSADCDGPTGTATVTVTGGTAPYTYAFSGGINNGSATAQFLPAGNFSVTVTDANGCEAMADFTVGGLGGLEIAIDATPAACGQGGGTAGVMIISGTGPFTYEWSTGATTPVITGLAGGTYSVTVIDANGCDDSETVTIDSGADIMVSGMSFDASCGNGADGSIALTVMGGDTPYSYSWSNGVTGTNILSNLAAGAYSVTVTDAGGCVTTETFTVGEPALITVLVNTNNAGCTSATGSATVTASGGTGGFTYAYTGGTANGNSVVGLAAGNYTVTVTDQNGCTGTANFTINADGGNLSASVTTTDAGCAGDEGTASVNVSGGTAPYTYAWSNGASGPAISGLTAGSYSVTITDAQGCTTTVSGTVDAGANTVAVGITTDAGVGSCTDADAGQLTATASGGTAPYTYAWSNGMTTATISGLTAGTYTVTATDANGCTATATATLSGSNAIGDLVFNDNNENGILDNGDTGVVGATLTLTGTSTTGQAINQTTVTTATGYLFDGLPDGTYTICLTIPNGAEMTVANVGSDDSIDSDGDATGCSGPITITGGVCNEDVDFGITDICDNFVSAGTIGPDQTLCGPGNDAAPILEITPPVGGSGTITYLWLRTTDLNAAGFPTAMDPIPNTNSPNYDPGVLFETTYFLRCVRREDCPFVESNLVTVSVDGAGAAAFDAPGFICLGESFTFVAEDAGAGATYSWNFGPLATPQTATGQSVTVTYAGVTTTTVSLTTTSPGCVSSISTQVAITNDPAFCGGGPFNFTINATATQGNDVYVNWMGMPMPANDELAYEVQRSIDGVNWMTLDELREPAPNGQTEIMYEYTDADAPVGMSYYRVQMTGPTGVHAESNQVEILNFRGTDNLFVHPNPATERVFVDILDTFNSEIDAAVVGPDGRIWNRQVIPAGTTRHVFELDNLPAGIYFLRMNYRNVGVQTYRIVVE